MKTTTRPSHTTPLPGASLGVEESGAQPRAGEVVAEIGLILAIHLAVALAIGLSLRALGIG